MSDPGCAGKRLLTGTFGMLNWFRKKRKAIIPLTGVMFLAGMFSLFCPHCLAKMVLAENAAVNMSETHDHCPHMGAGESGTVHSSNHCDGACGCQDHAMLTGIRHPVSVNDSKLYPDIRLPVLNEPYRSALSATEYQFTIGRPYKPDRACFQPLERNCVLLN